MIPRFLSDNQRRKCPLLQWVRLQKEQVWDDGSKDQELNFGWIKFEMPIKHWSGICKSGVQEKV